MKKEEMLFELSKAYLIRLQGASSQHCIEMAKKEFPIWEKAFPELLKDTVWVPVIEEESGDKPQKKGWKIF